VKAFMRYEEVLIECCAEVVLQTELDNYLRQKRTQQVRFFLRIKELSIQLLVGVPE
jgi:hypothetical protein